MKYRLIKPDEIARMCEKLRAADKVAFDVETGGLDPYTSELRLLQFSGSPEGAYVVDLREVRSRKPEASLREEPILQPIRDLLEDVWVRKVGHNLKFDAKFVKHHLGCEIVGLFDTFLGSKIEACGNPAIRHSLADAAERFLGIEVDKTEQRSDWTANELSERQLAYAAKDVSILHKLESAITKRLLKLELMGVANLENSIVMAMAQVELNGFLLDAPMWRQQLTTVKGLEKKAAAELQELLASGNRQTGLFGPLEIDLASTRQVAACLLQLGVLVPQTEKGNYTTNQELLEPLKYEYPAVESLQTWRGLNKQITSYGDNILDLIHKQTGRIHADFAQLRAPGGRMGCNNPNLQNVPQESAYRSCFRAAEGNSLVVADFSQIELRVMAAISDDKGMIAAFLSGKDFHEETARDVFGLPPEAEIPADQRTFAKRVNFGIGYGIGAKKLARMCGISDEQAEAQLERYFDSRPGLKKWLASQKYRGTRQGYVRTLSGRRVKFRDFNKHDRGEVSQIERLACNIPIQGTAADIFKRALCLIHAELKGTSGKIVNLVHDEFVVETAEGEAAMVAEIIEKCMEKAGGEYISSVPITADAKVMKEWAK